MGGVQFFSIFFLSKFVLIPAYTASNIPRRLGIAGFYALAMIVELLYFTKFVEENLIVSTLFIGVARICARNFTFHSVNGYCLVACAET